MTTPNRRIVCCCGCEDFRYELGIRSIPADRAEYFEEIYEERNSTETEWKAEYDADGNLISEGPVGGQALPPEDEYIYSSGTGLKWGTEPRHLEKTEETSTPKTRTDNPDGSYSLQWFVTSTDYYHTVRWYSALEWESENALALLETSESNEVGEDTYLTGNLEARASISLGIASYNGAVLHGQLLNETFPTTFQEAETLFGQTDAQTTHGYYGTDENTVNDDGTGVIPEAAIVSTFIVMLGPDGIPYVGTSAILGTARHKSISQEWLELINAGGSDVWKPGNDGFDFGDPDIYLDMYKESSSKRASLQRQWDWVLDASLNFRNNDRLFVRLFTGDHLAPVTEHYAFLRAIIPSTPSGSINGVDYYDIEWEAQVFHDLGQPAEIYRMQGSRFFGSQPTSVPIAPEVSVIIYDRVVELRFSGMEQLERGWTMDRTGKQYEWFPTFYDPANYKSPLKLMVWSGEAGAGDERKIVTGTATITELSQPIAGKEDCVDKCLLGPHGTSTIELKAATIGTGFDISIDDFTQEIFSYCETQGFAPTDAYREVLPDVTGHQIQTRWVNERCYDWVGDYVQPDGLEPSSSLPGGGVGPFIIRGWAFENKAPGEGLPSGYNDPLIPHALWNTEPSGRHFVYDVGIIGGATCQDGSGCGDGAVKKAGYPAIPFNAAPLSVCTQESVSKGVIAQTDAFFARTVFVEQYLIRYSDRGDSNPTWEDRIVDVDLFLFLRTATSSLLDGFLSPPDVNGEMVWVQQNSGLCMEETFEVTSGVWPPEAGTKPVPGIGLPDSFQDWYSDTWVLDFITDHAIYYELVVTDPSPSCTRYGWQASLDKCTNGAIKTEWIPKYYHDYRERNQPVVQGPCGGPPGPGVDFVGPWNVNLDVVSDTELLVSTQATYSGTAPEYRTTTPCHFTATVNLQYRKQARLGDLVSPNNILDITFTRDDLISHDPDSDNAFIRVAKSLTFDSPLTTEYPPVTNPPWLVADPTDQFLLWSQRERFEKSFFNNLGCANLEEDRPSWANPDGSEDYVRNYPEYDKATGENFNATFVDQAAYFKDMTFTIGNSNDFTPV